MACAAGLVVAGSGLLQGQELEPGLYQNAPVGLSAAIVGYGFSTGNILIDASLPLADVDAKIHTIGLGYVRTLAVFEALGQAGRAAPGGLEPLRRDGRG